jgi:hypothetical protein
MDVEQPKSFTQMPKNNLGLHSLQSFSQESWKFLPQKTKFLDYIPLIYSARTCKSSCDNKILKENHYPMSSVLV